jgi:dimethylglycine dehydrogenase
VGRLSLCYALTPQGKILSEFTVTRLGAEDFLLIGAGSAEWHDLDLLEAAMPDDGSVAIVNRTEGWGSLVLAGPRSRDLLGRVTKADLSNGAFPWLAARRIRIGGTEVLALRVNYVGELGYELHADTAALPGLYDALSEAGADVGLRDFGLYAMDSLRLDKAYRGWKSDIETGYSPFEASLDRFVALDKADFVGKAALVEERRRGIKQRFVPLTLDAPGDADALALAPVLGASETVGLVTSAGWSYTLNQSIALAYVRTDLAVPGQKLDIEILGEKQPATVGREPLYDPSNARLKG